MLPALVVPQPVPLHRPATGLCSTLSSSPSTPRLLSCLTSRRTCPTAWRRSTATAWARPAASTFGLSPCGKLRFMAKQHEMLSTPHTARIHMLQLLVVCNLTHIPQRHPAHTPRFWPGFCLCKADSPPHSLGWVTLHPGVTPMAPAPLLHCSFSSNTTQSILPIIRFQRLWQRRSCSTRQCAAGAR